MTLRAVIADDEPLARRRVRDLLAEESDVEVVAECEDGIETLRVVPAARPDLLFLDVQMPGLDGFDVLSALDPADRPAIVFTTAYESYAVRAFDEHALDYLLKPLDAARFRDAMARVRQMLATSREGWSARIAELLARVERREQHLRRIVVKDGGRVFFVETRDVDWLEAAGNYVRLHVGQETHLVRMTMQSIEQRLDPRAFARIHRSIIVNAARVAELQPAFRGEYDVLLKGGTKLRMQRAYHDRLRAALGDF